MRSNVMKLVQICILKYACCLLPHHLQLCLFLLVQALSQDKDKDADQGRKLQERLAAAEESRLARLADLSARAASKFSHAKSVNQNTKLLQVHTPQQPSIVDDAIDC